MTLCDLCNNGFIIIFADDRLKRVLWRAVMSFHKRQKTLNAIEENKAVIREELAAIKAHLEHKVENVDRVHGRINKGFLAFQTSLEDLMFVIKIYQGKRENISLMKRRILGAHRNTQLMEMTRQSWTK